jgi:hypothetical protein
VVLHPDTLLHLTILSRGMTARMPLLRSMLLQHYSDVAGGAKREIRDETEKWAKVIKFANIKPE